MRWTMVKTVGVLLLIFVVLAVAWGLTNDPVSEHDVPVDPATSVSSAPAVEPLTCSLASRAALPGELEESSGVAVDPAGGMLWSHNDSGGDPVLYASDPQGQLTARLAIQGASNIDWEDMEVATCETGSCVLIGDIGDNDAERDFVTIYRAALPTSGAQQVTPEPLHARYPDGARDAEGLIGTPDGGIYVVTKGRQGPIQLYQLAAGAAGQTATLQLIRTLAPQPEDSEDYVTAATASPDGRWIGTRTYDELRVYDASVLRGQTEPPAALTYDLRPLEEAQGEGLAIQDDGTVWLTSEAGDGAPPGFARLECTLPGSTETAPIG